MRKKLFGTDGLRGQANIFPMLPEIVLRLGLAAGQYFRNGHRRHRVLIGKDTRLSGYVFENALTSGFCASGMDVFLVGPMPTPAISFLTKNMRADLGVVISASHNPFMDNGIKFFDHKGFKLSDQVEEDISELVLSPDVNWKHPQPEAIGRARKIVDSPGRYIVHLKNSLPNTMSLQGMKVVIDCAHGATYRVAPLIFEELGAKVIMAGTEPDGVNINKKCGSLYPEVAASMVLEHGADLGLTLDGDGDRLIAIDENGVILDGDQIMAICAMDLMERDALPGNLLVSTVMSNMALEVFMQEHGGRLLRTKVGDRYVVEAMRKEGAVLGGEQSGHLIFLDYATTGDGILAGIKLLKIMLQKNRPLSELSRLLTPFPQRLINVHVERKMPFEEVQQVQEAVKDAEAQLGSKGRVLLRYSGTESVARVMVEGQDDTLVEDMAIKLARAVEEGLRA
ncbi:phosphoglucosamine mutase [Desulfonatronospira thiodismutans ASO3-1]|uniref:Phosphoglucosamine mutase n=1 Tax=Desulfonatronospira thiodismutans ASO3-1 TaxID=555779 RepID=D6SL27_9BACT|nr:MULTISPECIES: phosphoglucosamine mutase [Desulfonatronospira]EFI35388.1 phosphoglucosamine mutase [Desulfonatronospira thiodismutans ASO3-1]RQD75348.1 MAG: phosphoglucosamine mutase [Desulfonatronospira sp. MSAO_Bac3]